MAKGKQTKKRKKSVGQAIKLTLQMIVFFTLLGILAGIIYFYTVYGSTILQLQSQAKEKVRTSTEDTFRSSQTSLVYDTEGILISTLKSEKEVYYIEYEDIPSAVIEAMVISEDRKFMEHDGIDYWANVRAAIELIKHKGEITQGASTITQQLARNTFLTLDVTYERKIEEIFVAQELERKYSKQDILEFYLNEIYYANGYYGIQAAAQGYFGEGIKGLSLSQMVFLCAIPNNPNLYNPINHMDNTLKRRDRVLLQMRDAGAVTEKEYQEAINETITLKREAKDKKNYVETYVYYCAIRALMKQQGFIFRNQFDSEAEKKAYEETYEDLYYRCQKDLYVKGYRIYTSIDLAKQKLLQTSVDEALVKFKEVNEEGVYQMQGAAVSIDNDSGRVIAIVGGREQALGGYTLNRGYQSYRQPGSAIKPLIVYAPAFERDYTPSSTVVDEPIKDGPKNSGGNYLGKMKLQRAIELSKNTIAWKLFEELTPSTGLSYLFKMNFNKITEKDYVPAAALGGFTTGASPVEMAAAYATLENDGYYRDPTCIIMIMDSEGKEIVGEDTSSKQIYDTRAARIMTEALTGVITKGTAKGLGLKGMISAGKTGTTNDKKDGWFVGYTPYYTTSVWVGYDMPRTVEDLKGATYPGTIWHTFMEQIHDSSMKRKFELYDWRTELLKEKEKAKAKKELEEAKAKEKEKASQQEADKAAEQQEENDMVDNEEMPTLDDTQEEYEEGTDENNNEDEDYTGEDTEEIGSEEETTNDEFIEEDTSEEDLYDEANPEGNTINDTSEQDTDNADTTEEVLP